MEKICSVCGTVFEQNEKVASTTMAHAVGRDPENERCYRCALSSLTGGLAPEGSDFTSAQLISGEISDKEWRWFQEDIRDMRSRHSERSTDGCARCDRPCDECICDDDW